MADLLRIFEIVYGIYRQLDQTRRLVKANRHQCETLCRRIDAILSSTQSLCEKISGNGFEDNGTLGVRKLVETLHKIVQESYDFVQQFQDAKWYQQAFKSNSNAEKFQQLNESLSICANDLNLSLSVQIFDSQQDENDLIADMKDIASKQDEILGLMRQQEATSGERHDNMMEFLEKRLTSMKFHVIRSKDSSSRHRSMEDKQSSRTSDGSLSSILQVPFYDLEILSKLGSGGTGDVYSARWISRDDVVAVKMLRNLGNAAVSEDQFREDFLQELRYLASLRYEHIIGILGYTLEPDTHCMIMEYMPRGSLFSLLRDRSVNLEWPMKLSLALQMAKAINFLHLLKPPILHRDLKSLNFLIDSNFRVKVCDFGLAQVKTMTTVATVSSSGDNSVCGTLRWTAPERMKSFAPYSSSCDIFSLGICFWELATREIPYGDSQDEEIRQNVIQGVRLPIPPETPKAFRSIIESCWSADAASRPSSQDLVKVLGKLVGEIAPSSPPSTMSPIQSAIASRFNTPKTTSPLLEFAHGSKDSFLLQIKDSDIFPEDVPEPKATKKNIESKEYKSFETDQKRNETKKKQRTCCCGCCILTEGGRRCLKLLAFIIVLAAAFVPVYFLKLK